MSHSSSKRMSTHCVVPNWNLKQQQRQEQVQEEDHHGIINKSSHVTTTTTTTNVVPIPDYRQVKELTWENGQIATNGLGGLLPTGPLKPIWAQTGGTLESIVHQATCHTQDPNAGWNPATISSNIGRSAGRNRAEKLASVVESIRKRSRADSDTFCRDSDTTMVTWASFDSHKPNILKSKTTDEDSASQGILENQDDDEDQDQDQETKGESDRSNSTRRSRAAAVHNQSERRRRDRINQKMKALQELVPNASKTDKASMLDEVIDYLKQLQAQVQVMNTVRNMHAPPQMMMPLGIQQQHMQMLLLARMGMGMGMGMLDMNPMARAATHSLPQLIHNNPLAASATNTPTFLPPPFMLPPHMGPAQAKPPGVGGSSSPAMSVPLPDPYCALLAQSMNMELYSKMAALYSQQVNLTTQTTGSPSRSSRPRPD